MSPTDKLSIDAVWQAAIVIVLVCGGIVAVINAFKALKGLSKAEEYKSYFANDKARLDSHEARLTRLEKNAESDHDGIKVLVKAIMALTEHELHNGNADQMQDAVQELTNWLMR